MEKRYIIGLDEGTTSVRAGLYDTKKNEIIEIIQKPIKLKYPKPSFVELDATEIWSKQLACIVELLGTTEINPTEVFGIGITNQRETIVAWDKKNGKAICPSICWQCKRTAKEIENLPLETKKLIKEKTGLIPDAYFSASKISWILKNIEKAQELLRENRLCVGTIDSYLIFKLTKGKFVTDITNASRTMLLNIHTGKWDDELLSIFNIPKSILPEIVACDEIVGETTLLGEKIYVGGIAGDQQSALIGQVCFKKGMIKNTYGTGGFALLNTKEYVESDKLLSTIAYKIKGKICYALEGSNFNCGSTIQWLKEELELFDKTSDIDKICYKFDDTNGVYFVPAFTGLGSPHWNMGARGSILGLTRSTKKENIVRAGVESMAYSTEDILSEVRKYVTIKEMRCDGGASNNNFLMQFQSDLSKIKITLPKNFESTLLGAIYLCGLAVKKYKNLTEIKNLWQCKKEFVPNKQNNYKTNYLGWQKAVEKAKDWID